MTICDSTGLQSSWNAQSKTFTSITTRIEFSTRIKFWVSWTRFFTRKLWPVVWSITSETVTFFEPVEKIYSESYVICLLQGGWKCLQHTDRKPLDFIVFSTTFEEMYQPNTNIVTSGSIARSFFIIKQGIVICDREETRRTDLYHLGEGKCSNEVKSSSFFRWFLRPGKFHHNNQPKISHFSNSRVLGGSNTDWDKVLKNLFRNVDRFSALNDFMIKSSEYNDELKLIIALANETLKRNGEYARVIAKQREAKLYYG